MTEHHKKSGTLFGQPLKSGYNRYCKFFFFPTHFTCSPTICCYYANNFIFSLLSLFKLTFCSHYVVVDKRGEVTTAATAERFDEIVIDQEAQICPAYLLILEPEKSRQLLDLWGREVPESFTSLEETSSEFGNDLGEPLVFLAN